MKNPRHQCRIKVNKKLFLPILIVAIIASFSVGIYIGKTSKPSVEKIGLLKNPEIGKPADVDFSLFWDVWKQVEDNYVDRAKLDPQKMVYGAISGMLRSLDDPYTMFMPPDESKKFSEDMQGSFEGVGAEIGMRKGVLTVISPLEGSPAKKAGLMPLDQILKIDDTSTDNLNLDEAVNKIRGPKGSEVKFLIMRESWKEPKEFKITRDTIQIPVLKWEIRNNNIADIELYQFTGNISEEFSKIVPEIVKANPKGIILDLRGNPGGYLETAVDVAGWFMDSGKVVAIEDFGDSKKIDYRTQGGQQALKKYPMVVLIDSGSASAAEILAGALRDDRGIQLVGVKSFGKGSVQQLNNLTGGSSLKITIAKWLTPSGKSIMNDGLEPDVKVDMTEDDIANNRDPQLDKTLEMLK